MLKKKFWDKFERIISEIRKKPIPDPGVKKAPDPGSGSATLPKTQVMISAYDQHPFK
jgi:hypothetical protein